MFRLKEKGKRITFLEKVYKSTINSFSPQAVITDILGEMTLHGFLHNSE